MVKQTVYYFQGASLVTSEGYEAALSPYIIEDSFEIPSIDEKNPEPIRGARLTANAPLPAAWKAVPMRQVVDELPFGQMPDSTGHLDRVLRAFHISQWRQTSVYCGTCGSRNEDSRKESCARACPRCGRLEFPRLSPAVITIVLNDQGQALLAHNRNFADNIYSLIAGFTEAGETLEAAVAREIREEVGIEVRDIRYIASQPWPFPNSLMLGFTARRKSGTITCDKVEILDAKWFSKDALPKLPGAGSVSRFLISLWLKGELEK
ncbi:NAD(+) diphosphatase [Breznakiellaceae bacterium SP9]